MHSASFAACPALLVILVASGASRAEVGPPSLYWTDRTDGAIYRADIGGGLPQLVVPGLAGPQGIAIDPRAGRVYWADSTSQTIERASLDGSGAQVVVGPGVLATGIGLDPEAGTLYWTDPVAGTIGRSDLDGQNAQVFMAGLLGPQDVVVDAPRGRVLWAETASGIGVAALDGTPIGPLVADLAGTVTVLAIDDLGGRVAWEAASRIYTATMVGGCDEFIAEFPGEVRGLAADAASTLYWTDVDTGTIRALPAGMDQAVELISGLSEPWRLAIGPAWVGPSIEGQPAPVVATVGDTASFSVSAAPGDNLVYQWFRNGVPVQDGGAVAGAQTPTLTIDPVAFGDVALYRCEVFNAWSVASTAPVALGVRPCQPLPSGSALAPGVCLGDVDGDCDADVFDFGILVDLFGEQVGEGARGDLTCDGKVDVSDFAAFTSLFGCP